MPRIVLGLEYDGSGYHGWQWQKSGRKSVQAEVQSALSRVADRSVTVSCAGRTDAGVHALEQVVHFDSAVSRDLIAWVRGGNSHLPADVRILWAREAVDDFHARYSAIARFYRYVVFNRPIKSALMPGQTTWCYPHLDSEKMHAAAQYLVGEHDFSSFRAQACQSVSPCRYVHFVEVYRVQERVIIDIAANAFLHHMVRNIVGVLIAIGSGEQPVNWTEYLLQVKDRKQGGKTAPPNGLFLAGVYYPPRYGLEKNPIFGKLSAQAKRFD